MCYALVKAIVVVLSTSTPSRMYVVPSAPVPITSPLRLFVSSNPATKSCVVVCAKTPVVRSSAKKEKKRTYLATHRSITLVERQIGEVRPSSNIIFRRR